MAEELETDPKVSEVADQSEDDAVEPTATIEPSEFAFRLVNVVKAMNAGEISYHEVATSFSLADELKCLYLFIKALPYDPIAPIYPETPFLFFKGVPLPRAFDISEEIKKRRTFGIISHPDAGKTTLTEKLLLYGGAIQEAGAVKSNKIKPLLHC